jgi:TetR/AcrR family transcriptional repressor of nem operon
MKDDVKNKLIKTGAELIHLKGFNNTGLQEVLRKTGVPKGSFYFYFPSKEDFGLAVLDYQITRLGASIREILSDSSFSPPERLMSLFDGSKVWMAKYGYKRGCPIGNIAVESGDLSDAFCSRTEGAFQLLRGLICDVLKDAAEQGMLREGAEPELTADFILNGWEGAILRTKSSKTGEAFDVLKASVKALIFKGG